MGLDLRSQNLYYGGEPDYSSSSSTTSPPSPNFQLDAEQEPIPRYIKNVIERDGWVTTTSTVEHCHKKETKTKVKPASTRTLSASASERPGGSTRRPLRSALWCDQMALQGERLMDHNKRLRAEARNLVGKTSKPGRKGKKGLDCPWDNICPSETASVFYNSDEENPNPNVLPGPVTKKCEGDHRRRSKK